ncbi:hypothetical protein CONPUDRAFT_140821 [Coniophora puteana RWD-64-598 SS2]|uniref:F-box domain-containing protein n=1 Tax=Coniophora puteana (strain RWD-64-598) TaxID=741705 RepID=A0A5M3N4D6_CONPW|nr:uncharacterized protein CONPUDRAFT_140821 [Coniophora puteana RWD-64-598 SS2]EIW86117.1 hypothetical protein CONPUDRAFT_140821 [Coniophora puteana RWD-64-598 SS2]
MFEALISLQLSTSPDDSLSVMAEHIRGLNHVRLAPIEFTARSEHSSPSSLTDLFDALAAHFNNTTLRTLDVREFANRPPDVFIDQHTFSRLRTFQHLSQISIDTGRCAVDLDDNALLQMAEAWPNLMALSINPMTGWRRRSQVTFRGRITFISKLPQLSELGAAVDGNTLTLLNIEHDSNGQTSIEKPFVLDLLDTRIEGNDVPEVAACLADMFPCMGLEGFTPVHAWKWRYSTGLDEGGI